MIILPLNLRKIIIKINYIQQVLILELIVSVPLSIIMEHSIFAQNGIPNYFLFVKGHDLLPRIIF